MAFEYLSRIPNTTGNRKVWTFSGWCKVPGENGIALTLFGAYRTGTFQGDDIFSRGGTGNAFRFTSYNGSSYSADIQDTGYKLDPSSWVHVLAVANTTHTDDDKQRWTLFINGIKVTKTDNDIWPSWEYETNINNLVRHYISSPNSVDFSRGYITDFFFVDGQALTPDVFGYFKPGKGYVSVGSTRENDFRSGQWLPKTPRIIKAEINRRGGFGVNGFYLPLNDFRNFGADFHSDPNSIITLNEKLPQPRVGVATTARAGLGYTDVLRSDPYAANLVLALPFVSSGLCTNGTTSGINTGFGDYSAIIKGSGSSKIATVSSVSIANTASNYGNAANFLNNTGFVEFPGTSGDFNMGTGDFTIEGWFNPLPTQTSNARLFGQDINGSGRFDVYINGTSAVNQISMMGGLYDLTYSNDALGVATAFPAGNQWSHFALVRKNLAFTTFINGNVAGIVTAYTGSIGDSTNKFRVGQIGQNVGSDIYGFQGYIQDFRVYKGVAKYTGNFDVSRPYSPVGIATWRGVVDNPRNKFATFDPRFTTISGIGSFLNGNLRAGPQPTASGAYYSPSVGVSTGKWYWEYYESVYSDYPTYGIDCHVGSSSTTNNRGQTDNLNYAGMVIFAPGRSAGAGALIGTADRTFAFPAITHPTVTLPVSAAGNIYSIAVDLDGAQGIGSTGSIRFYINGVGVNQNPFTLPPALVGVSTKGTFLTPSMSNYLSGINDVNFGQNPTFGGNVSIGTFTDSNGKGLFKYQPPSGFLALCQDNLPISSISDPGKYFKGVIYKGSSKPSFKELGFKPDLIWFKQRSNAVNWYVYDSIRGPRQYFPLATSTVSTASTGNNTGGLGSFADSGIGLQADSFGDTNYTGRNYIAYAWQAGAGTTSTNTSGSITSLVSVNQTAGFSIVSYTGTGVAGTIGHGLGKTPKFILVKSLTTTDGWIIYHETINSFRYITMDTGGVQTSSNAWNNTNPTSSVFSVGSGTGVNGNGYKLIAYCWAEIEGYSKIGCYQGNGSSSGLFVHTGGTPAFVMIKRYDTSGHNWIIRDSFREPFNPTLGSLYPSSTSAEDDSGSTAYSIELLSNGFRLGGTGSSVNAAGATYIFIAFMQSPYTLSNAK